MNRIDGLCVTDKGRLGLVPLEGLTKAELKTAGANLAHVVVGNPGLVEHAPVVERYKTADSAYKRLRAIQANPRPGLSVYLIGEVMDDTLKGAYGIATDLMVSPGFEQARIDGFTEERRERYEKFGRNLTFWCADTIIARTFPDKDPTVKRFTRLIAALMLVTLPPGLEDCERYTLLRNEPGLSEDPAAAFLKLGWHRTAMVGRSAIVPETWEVEIIAN